MSGTNEQIDLTRPTSKSSKRSFESNLIETFEGICRYACDMIGVDHSGFVRFDNLSEVGEVVAQYPNRAGLIGRKIKLSGVPAEERLLDSEEPLIITDVQGADSLGEVRILLNEFDVQSICIVKVKFHDVVIGSFSLDSIGKTREFTAEEVALCKSFAELASKTIENAQLVDWLEAFQQATVAITSERESAPLLKAIITQAELLFSAKSVGLYQKCPDEKGEVILRLTASSDDDMTGSVLKNGQGMAWQLIRSDEPYLTTSHYDAEKYRETSYEGRFGSVLEVPLLRQDDRIGVVYLTDVKGRRFTEFDAQLLQRFADMATLALEHCSLLERMRQLSIATTEISGDFDSESLYDRLTKIAYHSTRILDAEMCGVFRVDPDERLVLQSSFGHAKGFFTPDQPFEIKDDDESGLTGAIAARLIKDHAERLARRTLDLNSPFDEKPLVFNACGDVLRNDTAVSRKKDASPSGECHSLLAIPLIEKSGATERVSGMLRISNKKGADGRPRDELCFNDDDEWVLRIFAEAVVVALESAELFDEINSQKDELTTQKEFYGQLLDTWNTLASEDPLESRLAKIAQNMVGLVGKSFCRILLANESEDFLTLKAAAVHPRSSAENQLLWNGNTNKPTPIAEWPRLKRALEEGLPYELNSTRGDPDETLARLSELFGLHNGNSEQISQVQSLFSIPMTVGSRTVGLLSVGELRSATDRRRTVRGKDRRTAPDAGFTTDQKNSASVIAAQATVMIDREWRVQAVSRSEQLLSRLSKALVMIRDEPDSIKKLGVITEQTESVFNCQLAGLFVQRSPDGSVGLMTSSKRELTIVNEDERVLLNGLLATDPLISNKALSGSFSEMCSNLPSLRNNHLKSILAVRFEYAAHSRCLLFVGDDKQNSELTAADLRVLEELARHCSRSLTRAAIREQLTRARDGVSQIAIDLALGDQKYALQHVVNGIRRALDCDAVTLYTIKATDNEITAAPATAGLRDSDKPAKYKRPVLDSPVGRVLRENRLWTADAAEFDAVMAGGFVDREEIKSSAGTPIWLPDAFATEAHDNSDVRAFNADKVAVGVLFVNYRNPHKFTEEDEKVIRMVAHLAAVAIRNQELFSQERRKATMLETVFEVSRAISASTDLSEILRQLAERVFTVAETLDRKVSVVAIILFENSKAKIYAMHSSGAGSELTRKAEIDLEPVGMKRGIVGRAWKERESQVVGDVADDPDYREIDPRTKSQLVVLIGEELCPELPPVGAITVESQNANAFDQEDLLAFKSLAALAHDAIRNDRLSSSDPEYALAREANLKDLALYYVKCGILIHNQKAHVEAIRKNAAQLQAFGQRHEIGSEMKPFVSGIIDNSQSLDLIRNLADLSSIQWTTIDVEELVETWKKRLSMRADIGDVPPDVRTEGNHGKHVRIDLLLMLHLLKIFVDNSMNAMRAVYDKKLTIKVTSVSGRWCSILISDTGRGIDRKRWQDISAGKNPQYGDSRPRKGLRTALLIATGFGGEIELLATSEAGTTFEIRLPLS